MATQNELNAAISKVVAAAIPNGLDFSASISLAAMPQAVYSQAAPPIPSLLQRLQDFRDAASAKPQPPLNQPATVEGRRNHHWREVAEYEKWIFPLYLYLENVDWQKVIAWYKARWHKSFIDSLWFHKRNQGFGYAARKIQRDQLLSGTTYRIRLALPIPTPAEYAQRKLREAQELYEKVFTAETTQELAAAPDWRRFLAEQLKKAAIYLGRREQSHTGHFKDWQPSGELKRAIEPEAMRSQGYSAAGELGKVLATVENFWQHWHAFHEAEQKGGDKPVAVAVNVSGVAAPLPLAHLHPAVQSAVGSRFADEYYSDALHKACTALEKAVQDKANQSPEPTGATLMSKVFSKDKPILTVSTNQGEQEGYMFLYRGLAQAIRNHYAHNDPATDPARALEWLSFISALFYKLDEASETGTPLSSA